AFQRAVARAKKKIERAENELRLADGVLRGMAHQNISRIRLDFGWAQMSLEKLLFELEDLFWSRRYLPPRDYLRWSGKLEQTVLEGMRRLRSVLDMLPFRENAWRDVSDLERSAPLVRCELLLYKLWRQFFVVGACYSATLSVQHEPNRAHQPLRTA